MVSLVVRHSVFRRVLTLLAFLTLSGGVFLAPAADGSGPENLDYSAKAPLAVHSLLLDGLVVDDLVVAVGERGHILRSLDQGNSWTQAKVPTRATLTGVFFHDRNLGWAVGHDAVILRTRDGGENWERVHYAPEEERPLLDVWFRDAETGFAIGAYGFFLETSDGGTTWSSGRISEDDFHLNQIMAAPNGRHYIAAEAGRVYRSDDEGETWQELPSPYDGSFFGTLPLDNDALLLFGLRGHLFRSEDAGESWQQLETSSEAMLTDALRLADGTILVAGLAGTVLVSSDGGRSFTLQKQEDRMGIATLVQTGEGGLVAIGEGGVRRLAWPDDATFSRQEEP